MIAKFLRDESGATAIEYGLIAALVAVATIGGMQALGSANLNMYNDLETTILGAGVGG